MYFFYSQEGVVYTQDSHCIHVGESVCTYMSFNFTCSTIKVIPILSAYIVHYELNDNA